MMADQTTWIDLETECNGEVLKFRYRRISIREWRELAPEWFEAERAAIRKRIEAFKAREKERERRR